MNIASLHALQQELITPNNAEWAQVIDLRNLVRDEFESQGHLTSSTYHTILDWKLRRQRHRTEKHRKGNTDDLIRELTGTFWRVRHPDEEKQLEIKLKVLMTIPGTGLGVASAILALSTPDKFAIIDFRNWKVLYNEDKRTFILSDYRKYLTDIRQLALQLDCAAQEIDYILWKKFERLG